jgi:stalled ribosome rescue protein Dom34
MKYQGTLGVHATVSEDTPVFDVFFAPNVDKSACNSRRFRELQELGEFLESLAVQHEVVARTLEELRKGRSASIENIVLSDEVIFDQGLDSTVTLNRRIN